MIRERTGMGLSCISAGSGRPLIFIHGWAMGATVWERQLEYFSGRGYEAVAIDLRGHGDSIKDGPYTLSQMAYDLKNFIHEKGFEKPFIAGWSMGAMIILELLAAHRHLPSGVCLGGGTAKFTSSDDYQHGLHPKDVRGMKTKLKRDFLRCLGEFRESIADGLKDHERDLISDAPLPSFDAAKAGLVELIGADLRSTLDRVDVPTLIIHGRDDRVCPPGAAEYMAAEIEGSHLLMIDDAGHVPFLSHSEHFNEELEKFIKRI